MKPLTTVDVEYRKLIDAMTISQQVRLAAKVLVWARGFVARQVLAERGSLSDERLEWEVALRQHGADPTPMRLEVMNTRSVR